MTSDLVTTEWLAQHLSDTDVVILDCSWHLPAAKRDARAEYLSGHVPGALFCDLDQISDQQSSLPHMLPKPEEFAENMGRLGIGNDTHVICYDAAGLFSAARVWWMFRVFGHDKISVLDGGLPKWKSECRALAAGEGKLKPPKTFTACFNAAVVADKSAVKSARQVADARSTPRFRGEEPEPRAGVRPGHIPGSCNVHYASLLNANGTMKEPDEIAKIFQAAGLDAGEPIVTSCGSGVTAAVLSLGLKRIGATDHKLYDGSWAEWGAAPDTDVATGP
jgi:thiosulfate/3-mercaptopyruvate sulfurtransferase